MGYSNASPHKMMPNQIEEAPQTDDPFVLKQNVYCKVVTSKEKYSEKFANETNLQQNSVQRGPSYPAAYNAVPSFS